MTFSLGLVEPGVAGPFGLAMGMKLSEFKGLEARKERGTYVTKEVPKPHSAFVSYVLMFGPKTGLCKIIAFGEVVETSVYGMELRMAFDRLEERLKAQYGKHEKFDHLRAGSIWNEPKDFMMSLLKQERFLASYWSAKSGSMLKDSLPGIMLKTDVLTTEKALLSVSYDFQNFQECVKELEAAEDDAL